MLCRHQPGAAQGRVGCGGHVGVPEVFHGLAGADHRRGEILGSASNLHALEVALHELAEIIEARGEYTYEEIDVKRFIPDADACEICEDAADLGWIPDEDTFEGVFGDEDGPPLHPHCGCELEYGTKRQRVYV